MRQVEWEGEGKIFVKEEEEASAKGYRSPVSNQVTCRGLFIKCSGNKLMKLGIVCMYSWIFLPTFWRKKSFNRVKLSTHTAIKVIFDNKSGSLYRTLLLVAYLSLCIMKQHLNRSGVISVSSSNLVKNALFSRKETRELCHPSVRNNFWKNLTGVRTNFLHSCQLEIDGKATQKLEGGLLPLPIR